MRAFRLGLFFIGVWWPILGAAQQAMPRGSRAPGLFRLLVERQRKLDSSRVGQASRPINVTLLLLPLCVMAWPALAQTQRVETYGTQSPAIIAERDVTISYGLSPEQVQGLTRAAAAGAVGPLAERIVELSERLGVTESAAITMLRIIGEQDVPFEKLPQKL